MPAGPTCIIGAGWLIKTKKAIQKYEYSKKKQRRNKKDGYARSYTKRLKNKKDIVIIFNLIGWYAEKRRTNAPAGKNVL